MIRITEQDSNYKDLDKMSINEVLTSINNEDARIAEIVHKAIPQIEKLVAAIIPQLKKGGRLFYIGAGTSGRLGIVDASECPPTFGVDYNTVIGIIAGGESAIQKAVENAEDKADGAWTDLLTYEINANDCVIGIAASGTTPYVLGGLINANKLGCITGCIVCNPDSPVADFSTYPIEVITGPEFLTGSTRMKAGTATKLVLNMISTATMIGIGRVKGNKMVNMKLANEKLRQRAINMLSSEANISATEAQELLEKHESVGAALNALETIQN